MVAAVSKIMRAQDLIAVPRNPRGHAVPLDHRAAGAALDPQPAQPSDRRQPGIALSALDGLRWARATR
jgi:ethanolamine ammonia-lyase large subunit